MIDHSETQITGREESTTTCYQLGLSASVEEGKGGVLQDLDDAKGCWDRANRSCLFC